MKTHELKNRKTIIKTGGTKRRYLEKINKIDKSCSLIRKREDANN